jgi:sirohydrochlorin ferrochelatase
MPDDCATAVLLIAHGSQRAAANADLDWVAAELRRRGSHAVVQTAYLEIARPTIAEGAACCAESGATRVVMLPYLLSPGVHACQDLAKAREELSVRFPGVEFLLAEPLGRHQLLIEVVAQRVKEAEKSA